MVNCLIYSVGDQREQELHVPNIITMVYCLWQWLTNFLWLTTPGQSDPVIALKDDMHFSLSDNLNHRLCIVYYFIKEYIYNLMHFFLFCTVNYLVTAVCQFSTKLAHSDVA